MGRLLGRGEVPWSSVERCGLTIQAMVLGRKLEPRLHKKTRWKDGRKIAKDNKDRQMCQVPPKTKLFGCSKAAKN